MKTITIDDDGRIIGYKTVHEKAKEFGVSDSMARIYARDGHVEAIYVGNTYYIKEDAKKPDLGKPGRKANNMKTITITIDDDGYVVGYKTTKEFAEECGVKEVTVRQWIRRGKMTKYIKIGSQYFIEEAVSKPNQIRKD